MNLTIAVDAEVLQRARIRAIREGTSVNAVLRDQLLAYAEGDPLLAEEAAKAASRTRRDAMRALIRLSREAGPAALADEDRGDGRDRRTDRGWTRDGLYER